MAGPSTCWMQQWRALKEKGIQKPDPRKQFLKGLADFLDALLDKDHELVLLLDANEDITEEGDFKNFITKNDLIDACKHSHPDSNPATYLRGHKWLDYVFTTPGLIPALRAA
eukprot:12409584-Ditylum_brightwellii.AAC.1